MIKDTVNNVHVSTEDVLITPEALSAEIACVRQSVSGYL